MKNKRSSSKQTDNHSTAVRIISNDADIKTKT